MGESYWIFVTAIYPSKEIAQKMFDGLKDNFSTSHLKVDGKEITGEIGIESRNIEEDTKVLKALLKENCEEGYLDTYVFDHTRFINEDEDE